MKTGSRGAFYINYLSVLFFLTYGFMMLDASGVTYYADIFMAELGVTAAQYSSMNAAVWCTKAISSVAVGILADRTGLRKTILVPSLVAAGILSIITAAANSFVTVLICRFLWGLCVGSTLSMLVSIIGKNLVKNDFGARSGFVSCGSAVIASTLGPILLTQIVLKATWRGAFVFTGGILILLGAVIQFTVKEVHCEKVSAGSNSLGAYTSMLGNLFRSKAFILCLLIGVFECAAKLTLTIFGPLYLTGDMHMDATLKGTLLSVMGLIYIPVSYIIPALADRFSPKIVMLATFVLCLLSPLAIVAFPGTNLSVIAYVTFGNWAAATVSIFIYVIPRLTLPEKYFGTANGLIMGVSVFFGGCVCPVILGRVADQTAGIHSIMLACVGMFAACILLTLMLDGTKAKQKGETDGNPTA